MDEHALQALLARLIARWEDEVVEFKRGGDGTSTSDIGKYFSALANEANLRNEEKGWLVFGVEDKSRAVVGTDYRPERGRLQGLKMQIAEGAEPSVTLRDIHELQTAQGRVLLLEIPAAPQGMPIAWQGHYYARAGESLTNLGLDKLDEIRRQVGAADWSAQVVAGQRLCIWMGRRWRKRGSCLRRNTRAGLARVKCCDGTMLLFLTGPGLRVRGG